MSCNKMAGGRRRTRKMRGGNGYGFGGAITPGALEVMPNMTSVPDGAPYKPMGGRRRRRSRKGKSRRTRRMRGGGSVASVGYGFAGGGAAGLANATAYPSNLPPGGAFAIPH